MDAFIAWWNGLRGWFFSTTEGAVTLAVIGNAVFATLVWVLLKFPKVALRLATAWGERVGYESAPAVVLSDTRVAVFWVGLKVITTGLHTVATLAFAYLLGPAFVKAGGIWYWVLTALLAYGVFKTVNGVVVLRISYEMVNGLKGGRVKQMMTKAMLKVASEHEGGVGLLRMAGFKIPGVKPGEKAPEKPPGQ